MYTLRMLRDLEKAQEAASADTAALVGFLTYVVHHAQGDPEHLELAHCSWTLTRRGPRGRGHGARGPSPP